MYSDPQSLILNSGLSQFPANEISATTMLYLFHSKNHDYRALIVIYQEIPQNKVYIKESHFSLYMHLFY